MTFLPIVARELRVRSRQAATWWGRCAVLLFIGLVGGWWFFIDLPDAGRQAFDSLSWLSFALVMVGGLLTVDCISGERRDGTLGFLFLTDLRGYDIVLGKMAVNGLWAVYAIMGLVPMLAVMQLAGGVTVGEVARVGLALLVILFLSLALGILASTRATVRVSGMRMFLVWMAALALLPIPFAAFNWNAGGLGTIISLCCPWELFARTGAASFKANPLEYWSAIGLILSLGGVVVWLAANRLSRNWRGEQSSTSVSVRRRTFKQRSAEEDPWQWLLRLRPGQKISIWVAVILMFGPVGSLVISLIGAGSWAPFIVVNVVTQWGATAVLVWICARVFIEGRQSGFIELVLTTPKGEDRLVKTYWNAIWRVLRVPLFLFVLLTFLFTLFAFGSSTSDIQYVYYGIYQGVSLLRILAICWLGMWFGVRARNTAVAIFSTVACVHLIPWVLNLLLQALKFGSIHLTSYAVQSVAVGICYLLFYRWARRQLLFHFREEISERRSYTAGMTDSLRSLIAFIRRVRHWT